jgi:mannitol-specific phosphotransferase system IIBC component
MKTIKKVIKHHDILLWALFVTGVIILIINNAITHGVIN